MAQTLTLKIPAGRLSQADMDYVMAQVTEQMGEPWSATLEGRRIAVKRNGTTDGVPQVGRSFRQMIANATHRTLVEEIPF